MQKENKLLYNIGKIVKVLFYIVITLICLIALFLVVYIFSSSLHANKEDYKPKISIYTIVSPSMTPVINVYDVVVNIRPKNEQDIQVGDIITYKSEVPASQGMMITHRVTEIEANSEGVIEYTTQGDSNSEPDSMPVTYEQIIGKEILIIPYLGKLQFLIADKKGWLLLCLIPIFFFILKDIGNLKRIFQLRKKVDEVTRQDDFSLIREQEKQRKENIIENLIEKEEAKKEKLEKQIEEQKQNAETNEEKIEVLDTDELTKIIKEYDKKIEELEEMLRKVEQAPKQEENSKEETRDTLQEKEEETFLREEHIKVILTEPTKNQKIEIGKSPKQEENKQSVEDIAIKPILNNKIEQTIKKPKKKKNTLNLKTNQVTKIATKKTEKKERSNFIRIEKTKK